MVLPCMIRSMLWITQQNPERIHNLRRVAWVKQEGVTSLYYYTWLSKSIYGLRRYTSAFRNNYLYVTYTMEFTIGGHILG